MTSKKLTLAYTAAAFAVILWASLAALITFVPHIPVFLLTGIGLIIGGLISVFKASHWKLNFKNIMLGFYGVAGFHLFYFLGLRNAPSVQTNLVNYLWPLLIVVLAPAFIKSKVTRTQILGSVTGFLGAVVAITSNGLDSSKILQWGYLFSFLGAVVWATFTLMISKNSYSIWQNGIYCFISGTLCIAISYFTEPAPQITLQDTFFLAVIGFGPMGAPFYLWNYAIRAAGAVKVAPISYFTPVISTSLLLIALKQTPSAMLLISLGLVIAGIIIGNRKQQGAKK